MLIKVSPASGEAAKRRPPARLTCSLAYRLFTICFFWFFAPEFNTPHTPDLLQAIIYKKIKKQKKEPRKQNKKQNKTLGPTGSAMWASKTESQRYQEPVGGSSSPVTSDDFPRRKSNSSGQICWWIVSLSSSNFQLFFSLSLSPRI